MSQSVKSHLKGFWPLWILMCVSKLPFSLNAFSHPSIWQIKRLSPVYKWVSKFIITWSLLWILSHPALEYLLMHPGCRHTKGFSPVWVSSSACKCHFVMNYWSNYEQTKGRSPVCVHICVLRMPASENSFKYFSKGQMNNFFSSFGLFTLSIWAKGWSVNK